VPRLASGLVFAHAGDSNAITAVQQFCRCQDQSGPRSGEIIREQCDTAAE
jgi:hypothetical protein